MADDYQVEYVGETIARVEPYLPLKSPMFVKFYGAGNFTEPIISINIENGQVEFGKGYSPNQAAIEFWEIIMKGTNRLRDCVPEVSHTLLLAAGHAFCWKCGKNLEARDVTG